MTALIIDDEVQIRRLLRMVLEANGYTAYESPTGQIGLQDAASRRPDVILLDLGLPDLDGLTVLKRIREWSDVPILVISVRSQEAIKIAALESGADDYVSKPFGTGELMARLHAIQRRRRSEDQPLAKIGPLSIDMIHHDVSLEGEPVKLTPIEYALLKVLAKNAGRIVTQRQLLREVWGPESEEQGQYLRVHITHLRKKLMSNDPSFGIVNEPGIGYRLTGEARE
jgi:two-component system KDP operon response regulator KdpE